MLQQMSIIGQINKELFVGRSAHVWRARGGCPAGIALVFVEQRHATERLHARLALVLLYFAVRLQMRTQVASVRERSTAVAAAEWLLA